MKNKLLYSAIPLFIGTLWGATGQAALVLDRTRVIYNQDVQSVSVQLTNKHPNQPYIAQSWIEDSSNKKIESVFLALPPLQRVEAGERNVVRITLLPGVALPSDRESVFYLNVREIPPKPERVNALQIALHSKIKLFYRPSAVIPKRGENIATRLAITPQSNQLLVNNPTPLHVTLVSLTHGQNRQSLPFEPYMLAPGESINVTLQQPLTGRLYVSHMNDYGGQQETAFDCGNSNQCVSDDKQRS